MSHAVSQPRVLHPDTPAGRLHRYTLRASHFQLQNQSELRAPTPEKAAWFLDAAIAARHSSQHPNTSEEEHRNSHMLFTLHIYQYRMEKTGKGGSKCDEQCFYLCYN